MELARIDHSWGVKQNSKAEYKVPAFACLLADFISAGPPGVLGTNLSPLVSIIMTSKASAALQFEPGSGMLGA